MHGYPLDVLARTKVLFLDGFLWILGSWLQAGGPRKNGFKQLSYLGPQALHDIMKINALLPTVQKSDAPYRGPVVASWAGYPKHPLVYLVALVVAALAVAGGAVVAFVAVDVVLTLFVRVT